MATPTISYGERLLLLDHVNKSYGGVPVLRDVCAEILDLKVTGKVAGQVVAFLGPSGCGKTTLFRIIAGLLAPDSGRVLINSSADNVHPGMVGVVSQQYTLFEHRTVMGNLMLGAVKKYKTRTIAEDAARDMLNRFGLLEKAKVYPAQLSGGQRQRIAILQQLLCSEHFILLDEPFSGLDPVNCDKLAALLTEIASLDELNTIILTSQRVSPAIAVADHVWLMGRTPGLPGASIVDVYDLASMGLCWQENIQATAPFADFVRQIKGRFPTL